MKKFYEKPLAEIIKFNIDENLMDIGNFSEGWEDAGDEEPI